MANISLTDQSPQRIRDTFNKGFAALERGSFDYAIDLLSACVQMDPEQLQARKYLRTAEILRFRQKKDNIIARLIRQVRLLAPSLKTRMNLSKGRYDQALAGAERLLRRDPFDTRFIKLFVDAAAESNLPEIAIQTLELVREHQPDDIQILKWLGALYLAQNRTRLARECFERLSDLAPHDPEAQKLMKDSLALDSMTSDKWADAQSYREVLKDEDGAIQIEREEKAVKSEKDLEAMIADLIAKIAATPRNLNYHRALARLYTQKADFDSASAILRKALEVNPGDPVLAKAISMTRVLQYDHDIEQIMASGDTEGAEAMKAQKSQFQYEDLKDKVQRYPNDLDIRYEWGLLLYQTGAINDAIQQFQLSQRHPKHRIMALYHLAMCFKSKNQYDLAMDELEKARSELSMMDETKKTICYELGSIAEVLGLTAKAAEYYKQIYQSDIGYRDVTEKVDRLYKK